MQTQARLQAKTACILTQQLVAAYLQQNTVTQCATKKVRIHNNKSLHIGKNCVARSNARV
jgi:hypothetical protein